MKKPTTGSVEGRTGVRWRTTKQGKKTFEARWRDAAGHPQSKGGFATAKAAAEFREDVQSEMRKGWNGDVAAQRKTWDEVAADWLAIKESRGTKRRTVEGYRRILRQHYAPWAGRRIGTISPTDVTKLVQGLATIDGKPLGVLTVHNVFNVASSVFDFAVRHNVMTSNPARVVREDLPKRAPAMDDAKERVRFLNAHEVNMLADAVQVAGLAADKRKGIRPDELKAEGDALMIRFMAWTGLRRGEIAGLRLRHLNPLRNAVRVEETVVRSKVAGWVVETPKTKRSRRTVPVPPTLMRQVLDFTQRKGSAPDDYVWGTGQRPRDLASFYRRRFTPATKAAGLAPMRIHDLRHTYASLMSHLGHRPVEISNWMGHANVAFTLQTYTHLFEDAEHEAERSTRLDAAFLDAQ